MALFCDGRSPDVQHFAQELDGGLGGVLFLVVQRLLVNKLRLFGQVYLRQCRGNLAWVAGAGAGTTTFFCTSARGQWVWA